MKSPHQDKLRYGNFILVLVFIICLASGFLLGYLIKPRSGKETLVPIYEKALVTKVIDGDTVELEDGRRVRYLGIDAPESNEPFYHVAKEKNRELVESKVVEMQAGERNVDEYGRLLRYVYIDGVFVNAELVAQGYAKSYIFDPNDRYSQILSPGT